MNGHLRYALSISRSHSLETTNVSILRLPLLHSLFFYFFVHIFLTKESKWHSHSKRCWNTLPRNDTMNICEQPSDLPSPSSQHRPTSWEIECKRLATVQNKKSIQIDIAVIARRRDQHGFKSSRRKNL